MFDNSGKKIKSFASIVFYISAATSLLLGFSVMFAGGFGVIIGLIVMIAGCIGAYVSGLMMSAIGDVADDMNEMKKSSQSMVGIVEDKLVTMNQTLITMTRIMVRDSSNVVDAETVEKDAEPAKSTDSAEAKK